MYILYHHRTQMQGGEAAHIRGIVKALSKLGHKVTVVSPYKVESEGRGAFDTGSLLPRRVYGLISRKFPRICFELAEIAYNLVAYRRMWDVAKHEKVDLIYERYSLYGISGVKLARRLNIPIILEVNIVSDLDDIRSVKIRNLAGSFEKSVLKHADAIITVSNFLKCHLISRGFARDKIWVVPNAVDPEEFTSSGGIVVRRKYGIEDSFIIGFVGNLSSWWYNLDALIKIVSEIVASGRKQVHLLLVGKEFSTPRLSEAIQQNDLTNHVTITGWIEHDRIPDYIDAMDLTVLPSSNLWGSPIKMFEYMVMGKPVIAPAYEPIKEIIIPWENGLLFEPENYGDLKQAVLTLIDDEDLRIKIGDNAKSTVIENYTWLRNAQKIVEVYKNLADSS